MEEIYVIFKYESDGRTYSEDTFIHAFENESVAELVAEELQKKFGYLTQFEEKTFSVHKKFVQPDKTFDGITSIVKHLIERHPG